MARTFFVPPGKTQTIRVLPAEYHGSAYTFDRIVFMSEKQALLYCNATQRCFVCAEMERAWFHLNEGAMFPVAEGAD